MATPVFCSYTCIANEYWQPHKPKAFLLGYAFAQYRTPTAIHNYCGGAHSRLMLDKAWLGILVFNLASFCRGMYRCTLSSSCSKKWWCLTYKIANASTRTPLPLLAEKHPPLADRKEHESHPCSPHLHRRPLFSRNNPSLPLPNLSSPNSLAHVLRFFYTICHPSYAHRCPGTKASVLETLLPISSILPPGGARLQGLSQAPPPPHLDTKQLHPHTSHIQVWSQAGIETVIPPLPPWGHSTWALCLWCRCLRICVSCNY